MTYDYVWNGNILDMQSNSLIAENGDVQFTINLNGGALMHLARNCKSLKRRLERVDELPLNKRPSSPSQVEAALQNAQKILIGRTINIVIK